MASSSLQILYEHVAKKVLTETLGMKKGEALTVETWNTGIGLAREVVKQARRMGCIPMMIFEDEITYLDGVKKTPKDVLGLMGKQEYGMLASTDAYVFIPGPPLGAYYKRITREEYSNATRYNDSWYDAAKKAKLRGARLSFGYVGRDLAGYLGKKVSDIAEAQMKATLPGFGPIKSEGRSIARKLRDGARATIATEGGELKFRLKGEMEIEDGVVDKEDIISGGNVTYLPPGFVSKAVDSKSATGTIKLSPSLTRLGVAGQLTLKFNHGRLVKWWSPKPIKFIEEILKSIEEENRMLSFLTVGLNSKLNFGYGVDRFVSGSLGISGFGFVGIVRNGSLTVGDSPTVKSGKL